MRAPTNTVLEYVLKMRFFCVSSRLKSVAGFPPKLTRIAVFARNPSHFEIKSWRNCSGKTVTCQNHMTNCGKKHEKLEKEIQGKNKIQKLQNLKPNST